MDSIHRQQPVLQRQCWWLFWPWAWRQHNAAAGHLQRFFLCASDVSVQAMHGGNRRWDSDSCTVCSHSKWDIDKQVCLWGGASCVEQETCLLPPEVILWYRSHLSSLGRCLPSPSRGMLASWLVPTWRPSPSGGSGIVACEMAGTSSSQWNLRMFLGCLGSFFN